MKTSTQAEINAALEVRLTERMDDQNELHDARYVELGQAIKSIRDRSDEHHIVLAITTVLAVIGFGLAVFK